MRRMILFLAVAGCAQPQPPPTASPPPTTMMMGRGSGLGLCPLLQAGATVFANDTPDGVALVVTATESQRPAVRQYVGQMATHHEQTRVGGRPQHHENLPPHSAAAVDIGEGAQLLFRPDEPEQLAELRRGVQAHAAELMARCRHP